MHPAKAVGRNETPFGRNVPVVPCNIVLDRGPAVPTRKNKFGGLKPQFAAMPAMAKLLWSSFELAFSTDRECLSRTDIALLR